MEQADIDVVYECTGIFVSKEKAGLHIEAGAKKVNTYQLLAKMLTIQRFAAELQSRNID